MKPPRFTYSVIDRDGKQYPARPGEMIRDRFGADPDVAAVAIRDREGIFNEMKVRAVPGRQLVFQERRYAEYVEESRVVHREMTIGYIEDGHENIVRFNLDTKGAQIGT